MIVQIVIGDILLVQVEGQASGNTTDNISSKKPISPSTSSVNSLPDAQGLVSGARATDSARITKFTNELSRPAVILGMHNFYIRLIQELLSVQNLSFEINIEFICWFGILLFICSFYLVILIATQMKKNANFTRVTI